METKIESQSLDHLGLVAGMIDYLELEQKIDELIPQDHDKRHLSVGKTCKSLILMGLGFTQRTLYMVSDFFEKRPVEQLLGPGIEASMLNDSVLGRNLDVLFEYGTTRLFSQLSPQVCQKLGLLGQFACMDITSFHLDGQYNANHPPEEESHVLHLTRGYSRDHRPDLNQIVLNLVVENQAGIPLHMEALDGNSNDKAAFHQTIDDQIGNLNTDFQLDYLLMDSAGYTKKIIELLGSDQRWISRVPETLGAAKKFVKMANPAWQDLIVGYQYVPLNQVYAGVNQRWLLVFSQASYAREITTLVKNYARKSEQEYKQLVQLLHQPFGCEKDATQAFEKFKDKCKTLVIKKLPFRQKPCYNTSGRPAKGAAPDRIEWYILAQASCSMDAYQQLAMTKGRFIVATNDLNADGLSDQQILVQYKSLSKVERGFRFLKDPQFVAGSFFVKKPERVEALVFIMTLCLTVYAAIEHQIRQSLKDKEQTLPNQVGKQVQNPTGRWIFAIFAGIHLLYLKKNQKPIVLNLKPIHHTILDLLNPACGIYYRSSG